MITVEVVRSGLQLEVLADKVLPELKQKLIECLADVAYSSAFYEAPWRTGHLAQSLIKQVEQFTATVSPMASYAVFIEEGTRPHEIRPVRARALCFESASGGLVFSQLVHHPGTKANPFMRRAADETARQAPTVFQELWNSEVKD